jgi:glycosyltransferase involved in cell wall biosynthesis
MNILVTIIMNCYNGEKYLKEALDSVIKQKYKNWELIFWDNRSTDNSRKILDSFNEKRFKYFLSEKHTTLYEARNLACKKAKGEFIAFIDCDDLWYQNFLSERKNFFKNKDYKFSYSNCHYYYQKKNRKTLKTKKKLKSGLIYDFLAHDYLVAISSLIIRKDVLIKNNFFRKKYNIIGDFDLVMRISKKNKASAIQKPLSLIRIHDINYSNINKKIFFKEYRDWFLNEKRDLFFSKNKKHFFKRLLYLYCVSLTPEFIRNIYKNIRINMKK